jgi:hypothetical protein
VSSRSTLVGAAGQHYVLSQLLRHGWIAALAPEGVPNVDIIATDTKGRSQFAIQVKTRSSRGKDGGWHMSAKHEKLKSESLFYCFVDFEVRPTITYVIPAKVVAKTIALSHRIWLSGKNRKGKQRRDTPMRWLLLSYEHALTLSPKQAAAIGDGWIKKYRENWKLLHL